MDGARGDQMLAFTFFITDVCVLSRMEWSSLFGELVRLVWRCFFFLCVCVQGQKKRSDPCFFKKKHKVGYLLSFFFPDPTYGFR
jgi:hypothetical protein